MLGALSRNTTKLLTRFRAVTVLVTAQSNSWANQSQPCMTAQPAKLGCFGGEENPSMDFMNDSPIQVPYGNNVFSALTKPSLKKAISSK